MPDLRRRYFFTTCYIAVVVTLMFALLIVEAVA